MEEFGVKCLVFSSSATVYDVHNAMPLKEEDVCACTNPYGWTKWIGEQILRDVGKVDAQMAVVLLRYFNPIGAHESGLIGEDPNGIPNNLMPYISQVAVGKGRSCPFSAMIMIRRMAPVSGILFMSGRIWRRPMWLQWIMP